VWPFARGRGRSFGDRGEDIARDHLRNKGLRILARNYRTAGGEIDIIALDASTRGERGAETLCFVEVKTRSSDRYTDPDSAVDARKQQRIRKAAGHYLARRDTEGLNVRFDIVSVILAEGSRPQVTHITDAF